VGDKSGEFHRYQGLGLAAQELELEFCIEFSDGRAFAWFFIILPVFDDIIDCTEYVAADGAESLGWGLVIFGGDSGYQRFSKFPD
jgi:hypothetical protein